MLPGDGTLTDPSLPAPFLWKMRSTSDPLTDYEMGADTYGDASGGLTTRQWKLEYRDPDVVLSSEGKPDTVLFSRTGITELALAFDQSMNAFVAFVESGQAKFWWFDTNVNQMVFTDLPADAERPRCCLDDRLATSLLTSDIVLAYLRGGDLFCRQQRDRYTVEYQLTGGTTGVSMPCGGFVGVGMNTVHRLQFQMGGA